MVTNNDHPLSGFPGPGKRVAQLEQNAEEQARQQKRARMGWERQVCYNENHQNQIPHGGLQFNYQPNPPPDFHYPQHYQQATSFPSLVNGTRQPDPTEADQAPVVGQRRSQPQTTNNHTPHQLQGQHDQNLLESIGMTDIMQAAPFVPQPLLHHHLPNQPAQTDGVSTNMSLSTYQGHHATANALSGNAYIQQPTPNIEPPLTQVLAAQNVVESVLNGSVTGINKRKRAPDDISMDDQWAGWAQLQVQGQEQQVGPEAQSTVLSSDRVSGNYLPQHQNGGSESRQDTSASAHTPISETHPPSDNSSGYVDLTNAHEDEDIYDASPRSNKTSPPNPTGQTISHPRVAATGYPAATINLNSNTPQQNLSLPTVSEQSQPPPAGASTDVNNTAMVNHQQALADYQNTGVWDPAVMGEIELNNAEAAAPPDNELEKLQRMFYPMFGDIVYEDIELPVFDMDDTW